jgi:hypothetical protein
VVTPNLEVSVHAIGQAGLTHGALTLNPRVPLGAALALAAPALGPDAALAASALALPAAATSDWRGPAAAADSPASPGLRLLRNGQLVALDPSKSSEEQGITSGEDILLQAIQLSDDDLQKLLTVLAVQQGNLQEAVENLRGKVERQRQFDLEDRQFAQRDRVLRFILGAFACLLAISLAMIAADALHVGGFQLTTFVKNSLVASVVGEVAGFVAIALRFVFPRTDVGGLGGAGRDKNGRPPNKD